MAKLFLALGGALALLNFTLSFVRVPVLLAWGVQRAGLRCVSGVPFVASACLGLGLWLAPEPRPWLWAGLLFLADTGGPHWFAFVLLRERLRLRRAP